MALDPIKDPSAVPDLKDGRQRAIGQPLQRWLSENLKNHRTALQQLGLSTVIASPYYGPSIKIDLSLGGIQRVVATNGAAFTISAPINITQLAAWTLVIVNSSGGTLGAVTFDPSIHGSAFVAPASGHRVSAHFYIEAGSVPQHYQTGQWTTA
jgi:hypothetical protein